MAMTGGRTQEGEVSSFINVTPLVDVCLVLVIIFMVTTEKIVEERLTVTLPRANTVSKELGINISITISADGRYTINSIDTSKEALPGMLSSFLGRGETLYVIVRGDKDCKYGDVQDVVEIIKRVGAAKISIATKIVD